MRKGLLALTIVLAGCNEAATEEAQPLMGEGDAAIESVPEIPEGSYLNASAIISEISDGGQWRTDYEPSGGTCSGVATLNRVTDSGIVLNWVVGLQDNGKATYQQRLASDEGRLCQRNEESVFVDTIDVFRSSNNLAEISPNDRSIRYLPNGSRWEGFEDLRRDMAEAEATSADETCWGYFRANSPASGLDTEILMRVYMDGVQQPDDFANSRGAFFGPDTQLRLRSGD